MQNQDLWTLIDQITGQIDQMSPGVQPPQASELFVLGDKLKRLANLHKLCLQKEREMRARQLSLMVERNTCLRKCKDIEQLGQDHDWSGTLLAKCASILYSTDE